MRSVILFALAVALSACGTIKPPPDVDLCTGVYNAGKPYAYCLSYHASSNREYKLTEEQVFKDKMIMISPDHYGEALKYIEYLHSEAKRRCK